MKPYYDDGLIRIYLGDARELVADLAEHYECILTDPPWPSSVPMAGSDDPAGLLATVLEAAQGKAQRLVLHLGQDSDPRLLKAVPDCWPFLRVCWLEYACPSYKGRLLYTGDVAYVFGEPPAPRPGAFVLPGRYVSVRPDYEFRTGNGRHKKFSRARAGWLPHPTPRRLQFVVWLVKWFGGSSVLDPFMGSGTTLVACQRLGIPAAGIDIEESYCRLAVERLRQPPLFSEVQHGTWTYNCQLAAG